MYDDLLSNRQKLVLKAIVEEYVNTGEPIGSKSLIDKPYLDFSSATIRNDMAYLEGLGLLEKTHTSSGRIPSQEGYRYYVDNLVTRDFDVVSKFPLIDNILNDKSLDREEMIQKSIDLLASLTNYMAFASENRYDHAKIAKLDLVKINNKEALLIIVTSTAKVETKHVYIPDMGFEEFEKVIKAFDKALAGKYLRDVIYILQSQGVSQIVKEYIEYKDEILNTFTKAFSGFEQFETIRSDMDSIFEIPEFQDIDRIRNIVRHIEQNEFHNTLRDKRDGLQIQIGVDEDGKGLRDCTIISIPYQLDEDQLGTIAVIGPKRMEYNRVIPLLEYLANNMSKLFKK